LAVFPYFLSCILTFQRATPPMKIKPKYTIKLSTTGWFTYYDAKTGNECGIWDPLTPSKKKNHRNEISYMPRDFRKEIINRILHDRGKLGGDRRFKSIANSVYKSGILCGWQTRTEITSQGYLVFWEAPNPNKKIRAEFAFAIMHHRWRNFPGRLKPLLGSDAFLRFVVDNGGKVGIWGVQKKEL
jgi:hypothetical protein